MAPERPVKNLDITQDPEGYRYSIEPFLLANFVRLNPGLRVLDIGTGCGIIPLLMATREPQARITAVEIQDPLYQLALRNVSVNGLSTTIQVIHNDFIKEAESRPDSSFDLIVSNPPYRKKNTGRVNPNPQKATARHELSLNLGDLIRHSASLLASGGRIAFAYPPNRLPETLAECFRHGLSPARLRFVHGYQGAEARIFLLEALKGRHIDCVVESPLCVYNGGNTYTLEMEGIYDSFNNCNRPDYL